MDVYSIFAGLEDKVLAFHKGSWPSCPQPDGTVLEDIVNRIAKLQFVFVSVLVVIQAVQVKQIRILASGPGEVSDWQIMYNSICT